MKQSPHLNPFEARLRDKPRPLASLGRLASQFKAQNEGGLASLLYREAAMRQRAAREAVRRARFPRGEFR